MTKALVTLILSTFTIVNFGQIIADHTIVDQYEDIPQQYIDEVKKMLLILGGESHTNGITGGLDLVEQLNAAYQVDFGYGPGEPPQTYTDTKLRAERVTWGDYDNESGWINMYGEEDWFTNQTALSRTKAGISYMNSNDWEIGVMGFVWCWDMFGAPSTGIDPIYGCHWHGTSINGPDGAIAWGLDEADFTLTGNSVCLDTYLEATQEYIDYCSTNGYDTKIFFATGPADQYGSPEERYQAYLKYEHIREYVSADPSRILFDYADILSYGNDGSEGSETWNDNTFPWGTITNTSPEETGHISNEGALRLGKAMWWMLARIAGWDGTVNGEDNTDPSVPQGLLLLSATESSVSLSWTAATDNVGVMGYKVYRDGVFLESSTELSFTDNTVSGCTNYYYTVSAFDAAGNESSQSEALLVNPCAPDVTPTITLSPNVANGVTIFELIVRVTELNSINTSGDIIVHVPKDLHWDLSSSYDPSLASLGGTSLNNSDWSYSEDTDNHIFTSSTTILAGSYSTFGFRISFDPGSSTGMNPITTQLVSGGGGEVHVSNNSDSEQLDYFQQ